VALFAAPVLALFTMAAQVPPPPPPRPQPAVQGPTRDPGRRPPPEPTGTALIRGRVVAADTGSPVRRANVNLIPTPPPPPPPPTGTPPGAVTTTTSVATYVSNGTVNMIQMNGNFVRPRNAVTDAQGGFEFTGLPPGTYRVQASSGQYQAGYLGMSFGGKRPIGGGSVDLGTPIELTEGQAYDKVTIALPRGAVITGRVTDENGEAMARVQVYTMFYPTPAARGQRLGNSAQTDDLGQFRLFGLMPGDYVVAAEARSNTFVPPNAPSESEEDRIGFMTTFYPTAVDESSAQRVRTRAGSETPGVEIRMAVGRLYRLSGLVTDSQGRPAARASGSVIKGTPGGSMSNYGFGTDEQGRFQMRNIAPGNYRVTVRQQMQRAGNGQVAPGSEPGEFASVPVNIASDVEGLLIVTGPGVTITGQIVLEQGPASLPQGATNSPMRINATPADPENQIGIPTPPGVTAAPDLTFTMKGMMGEYVLRTGVPGQYLKAVMLGSEDITDTPREFKSGDRVTLVMTSRASTLEGSVTDDKGEPVTDAGILLFSEDKASWRNNSSRTRRSNVASNGRYRMLGLMPGRYFIAALPRDRMSGPLDAAFFEQLAKEAGTVVVGEDENRQADLKLLAGGGL
jgi:protocatechuate 3,4-dioxygenase beta subunit